LIESNRLIAILLSTYNGAQFLRIQLDSLFAQTYKDWTLFVRDDGSTDDTLEILNSYKNKYSNFTVFPQDNQRMGPAQSFVWLLENVNADYYFLCDQDDFWLPNKIEKSLGLLKKIEVSSINVPAMVFTDLVLVDKNLKVLHQSMWDKLGYNRILSKKFLCCINFITGCTVCLNKPARQIVLRYKELPLMHDALIGAVISRYGRVKPLCETTVLYRQHQNNVIGSNHNRISIFSTLANKKISLFVKIYEVYKTLQINYKNYKIKKEILNFTLLRYFCLKLLIILKRYKK
jgi:glycosyltransferase involved in cell wall biosynthesis